MKHAEPGGWYNGELRILEDKFSICVAMIGWGLEDCDFVEDMRILGLKNGHLTIFLSLYLPLTVC